MVCFLSGVVSLSQGTSQDGKEKGNMVDYVQPIREMARELLSEGDPALSPTSRKTMAGTKLLMKPVKYDVMMYTGERAGGKDQKQKTEVSGIALNRWVAISGPNKELGKDGWSVDHMPTGKAIVQDLKNRKLALIVAKSFIDYVPEEIQKQKSVEKLLKQISPQKARAFYMYLRDVMRNRTDLPFEEWKKDTTWAND